MVLTVQYTFDGEEERTVTRINPGDFVTYVGPDRHGGWADRFRDRIVGLYEGPVYGGSAKVRWGDGSTPSFCSLDELRKVQPGDEILGQPTFPRTWDETPIVGTMRDTHNGSLWIETETDPGPRRVENARVLTPVADTPFQVGDQVTGVDYWGTQTWTGSFVRRCPGSGGCSWVSADGGSTHHVKTETLARVQEEDKIVTEAQPFIGPAPETKGPKYQTPFRISSEDESVVVDNRGHAVAEVDLQHDYASGDDRDMARAIRDALNLKFGA